MPRNASGTYTLVAGNPVATGTIIESNWANTTLDDLAAAMTDSLSRTGDGGMLVSMAFTSGTVSAPGIAWTDELNTGFYRAGAGDMRAALLGTDTLRFNAGTVSIWDGAAWVDLNTVATDTATNASDILDRVLKAGDTMTGNLSIDVDGADAGIKVISDLGGARIYANLSAGNVAIQQTDDAGLGEKTWIFCTRDGGVTLRYDNAGKLSTTLGGGILSDIWTAPTAAPGTDTTQIATTAFVEAANVAQGAVVTSTGSNGNGYFRIWSDGHIEQWGSKNVPNNATVITLPTAFATNTYSVTMTIRDAGNHSGAVQLKSKSTASFTAGSASQAAAWNDWIAVGT